jgi:hypothetical protein
MVQKQKGRHVAGPFLANVEPKLASATASNAPPVLKGAAISANHFGVFDFFFFFAMMKILQVWTG